MQLFNAFKGWRSRACPIMNLPEAKAGAMRSGPTSRSMATAIGSQPILMGATKVRRLNSDDHLRRTKFVDAAATPRKVTAGIDREAAAVDRQLPITVVVLRCFGSTAHSGRRRRASPMRIHHRFDDPRAVPKRLDDPTPDEMAGAARVMERAGAVA